MELGWRAHYTNRRYGGDCCRRITWPSGFSGRVGRWLSANREETLAEVPARESRLDHDQKREFLFGWLNWFGAETIAVGAALLNLIWVPFIAFDKCRRSGRVADPSDTRCVLCVADAFCLRIQVAGRGNISADAGCDDGIYVGSMDGRKRRF